MATFTYTFATISQVLKHGGEIKFNDLVEILLKQDPQRFRDEETVERAVTHYTHCLTLEGGTVRFNRDASRYAEYGIMERDVQAALHGDVPNMDKWALYPFKTRQNSDSCYLGIPWADIPLDPEEKRCELSYPLDCDFRLEDTNSCRTGCRVSEEILRKRGIR